MSLVTPAAPVFLSSCPNHVAPHGPPLQGDVPYDIQVVIAAGSHLFPSRTEKLSPPAPMVLQCNAGE